MSFKLSKISPICSAFKYESNQRVHWTNIYPLCKVPQQSPSSLAVNASGSGLCGLAISDIAVRMMPSALTSCSAGGRLTAYKKVAAVSLHSLIPASRQQKGAHTADMERRSWNLFLKPLPEMFLHGSRPTMLPVAMQLAWQFWPQMWQEAKNYLPHRNTCQTHKRAERNRFRVCKHSEEAQEKSSRVNANSNLQVLQRSGAIASEKLAICHLSVVRTGQEGTTMQRSEAIAQLAGSLSGSQTDTPGKDSLMGK